MAMYPFDQLEEDDTEMMDDAPELPDYGDSLRGIGEYQPAPTKLADLAPAEDKTIAGATPNQEPKSPLATQQQLLADYVALSKTSPDELKKARDRDRMLKIGGSIGDALATYLNAQGQMNVKAPGVQVQQGAGLGKVADMFATAPEIASDIKDRREALLAQYKAMSKDQDLKNSPTAWQIVPIVENGVQRYISVNKITNEMRPIGEKATHQQFRVDPGTGNIYAYDPIKGTRMGSASIPDSKIKDTSGGIEQKNQGLEVKKPVDLVTETFNKLNPNQKEVIKDVRKEFNKDTEKQRDVLGSVASIRNTLEMAPDNAAASNAFGSQLARLYQDGRLSDKDVDLYVKNKQIAQKIKSTFYDAIKGTMDPDLVPVYKQLIDEMEKGINDQLDVKADYYSTQSLKTFIDDPSIRKELIYPKQSFQYKKPIESTKEIPIGTKKNKIDPKTGATIPYIKTQAGWEPVK